MSQKYHGSIETLKAFVASTEIPGEWKKPDGSGKQTFRSMDGAILNWWPNGTVNFQGSPDAKAVLEQTVNSLLSEPSNSMPASDNQNETGPVTGNQPLNRFMNNCEVSPLLKRIRDALANSGLSVMLINDSTYIVRESDYDHCCSLVEWGSEIYIREL